MERDDLAIVHNAALPAPWTASIGRLDHEVASGQWLAALWCLRDAIECAVRILAGTTIAERLLLSADQRGREGAALLGPLLERAPSLGTWVVLLQKLAHDPAAGPFGGRMQSLFRDPGATAAWSDLFTGADNFVSFRNRTLGHGAFTDPSRIQGQILRFRDRVRALSAASATHLWGGTRFTSSPTSDQSGSASGWRDARLVGDGIDFSVLPLLRLHVRATNNAPTLVAFDRMKFGTRGLERSKAAYIDFLTGDLLVDDTFFPLIRSYWTHLAPANAEEEARRERIKRLESEHDEAMRFERRAVPVGYLLRKLSDIAHSCRDYGRYVVLSGAPGAGKSWLLRLLMRITGDLESPDWQRDSPLYDPSTARFRVSLGRNGLDRFWEDLAEQARTAALDSCLPQSAQAPTDLATWLRKLQSSNPQLHDRFVLIGIDAVDEGIDSPATVARLSALLARLPLQCMVVMTTRSRRTVHVQSFLDGMLDREGERLVSVAIDPSSPDNQEVQRYLLRMRLRATPALCESVLQRSQGVFLYTCHFAHALERGVFSSMTTLPAIEDFYPAYFDHLARTVGSTTFDQVYLRIMIVLACVSSPLTADQLHEDWGLPDPELLRPVITDLGEFIEVDHERADGERYRVSHQLIRDFILSRYAARVSAIETQFVQAAVARVAWSGGWASFDYVNDPGALYVLLQLPAHASRNPRLLATVLEDESAARVALALATDLMVDLPAAERLACARRASAGAESLARADPSWADDRIRARLAVAEALLAIGAPPEIEAVLSDEVFDRFPVAASRIMAAAAYLLGDLAREGAALAKGESALPSAPPDEQAKWLMARAQLLQRTGQPVDGQQLALRAAEIVARPIDAAEALLFAATCGFYASLNKDGLAIVERVQRDYAGVLSVNPALQASLSQVRGFICHNLDRNREVVQYQRQCRNWHLSHGAVQNYLLSEINVADGNWGLGRYEAARDALEKALTAGRAAKLPQVVDVACICLANVLASAGVNQEVSALYREGITVAREVGHTWDEMYGLIYQARWESRPEDLVELAGRCVDRNYNYLAAIAWAYAAACAMRKGLATATHAASRAVENSRRFEVPAAFAIGSAVLLLTDPGQVALDELDTCLGTLQGLKAERRLVMAAARRLAIDSGLPHVREFLQEAGPERDFTISDSKERRGRPDDRTVRTLLLKRCELTVCEGMCCYDGVYLSDDDEWRIREALASEPEAFRSLPPSYITEGSWRGIRAGRKTEVRAHNYKNPEFPRHFTRTRCVFALEDARCSLQVLAERQGKHKWTYKPKACWMHPLRERASGLVPPPERPEDDPDRIDDSYPGYTAYTECGRARIDGEPWTVALADEVEYWKRESEK